MRLLTGNDSSRWASVGASAAVHAQVGVDHILAVAFRDGLRRTFARTCATHHTIVVNQISHNLLLLELLIVFCLHCYSVCKDTTFLSTTTRKSGIFFI